MATPHKYFLVPKRIMVNSNGDVILKLKSPYRDGTTHWVMTGLDFWRAKTNYLVAALAHPCASQHLDILVQRARLLKRVFNIDMARCPNCQGRLTIIAAIEDPSTIAKILKHLGLPARAPPRAPAKNPAFYEFTEFA